MNNKNKSKAVSIEQFIQAIEQLPSDEFHKDQWLRWLKGYDEPGPFDRHPDKERSAKFVYNKLAYPEMLLWLIQAAGVDNVLIQSAKSESENFANMQSKSKAIRKYVPWDVLERTLWG